MVNIIKSNRRKNAFQLTHLNGVFLNTIISNTRIILNNFQPKIIILGSSNNSIVNFQIEIEQKFVLIY
jgi:hypothetical protein